METVKKSATLMLGLVLLSVGIVMGIQANLGVAPWDVLHIGITNYVDLSLGQINIIVGLIIVCISSMLGQYPGVGTVLNILVIGSLMDFFMLNELIPRVDIWWQQLLMISCGIYLNGWGTAIYLKVGWGSGPRDSLLVALMHKTGKKISVLKAMVELSVLSIGFVLGGPVGLGTVILALAVGVVVQHAFNAMKINPVEIVHKTVRDLKDYTVKEELVVEKNTEG